MSYENREVFNEILQDFKFSQPVLSFYVYNINNVREYQKQNNSKSHKDNELIWPTFYSKL